jgi:hypothetical protein
MRTMFLEFPWFEILADFVGVFAGFVFIPI